MSIPLLPGSSSSMINDYYRRYAIEKKQYFEGCRLIISNIVLVTLRVGDTYTIEVELKDLNLSHEISLTWLSDALLNRCHIFPGDNVDVSLWNPESVKNASRLFKGWENFLGLGLQEWSLLKLSKAEEMFYECRSFVGDKIDCWALPELEDANSMFSLCENFNPQSVARWRPEQLRVANKMFDDCTSFTGNGIDAWNLSNLEKADEMFYVSGDNSTFNPTSVSKWSPVALISAEFMFRNCKIFTGKGADSWQLQKLQRASHMFSGCSAFNAVVAAWCPENLVDAIYMFRKCGAFEGEGLANWGGCLTKLTRVEGMFSDCANLKLKNLSTWELPKVEYNDLQDMLSNVLVKDGDDIKALKSMKLRVPAEVDNINVIHHIFGSKRGAELFKAGYKTELEKACNNWKKYDKLCALQQN